MDNAWEILRQLVSQTTGLWCIFWDFNEIMDANEKRGRPSHLNWLINEFRQAVLDSGFSDVQVRGYLYTWFKSMSTPGMFRLCLG